MTARHSLTGIPVAPATEGINAKLLVSAKRAFGPSKVPDVLDGCQHLVAIDRMNIDGLARHRQHGQGQPTTQVLAELLKSIKQHFHVADRRIIQTETQIHQANGLMAILTVIFLEFIKSFGIIYKSSIGLLIIPDLTLI